MEYLILKDLALPARNTRNQLKQVFDTLRELMTPPEPHKRPIGFITPEDKSKLKAIKSAKGASDAKAAPAMGAKKAKK